MGSSLKKKFCISLILGFFILSYGVPASNAVPNNQPYFRVKYQIPKMPTEVSSKAAAAKNLQIYKQYLQKNKLIMAEKERQNQARAAFVKNHNEITVSLLKDDRRENMRFNCAKLGKPVVVTMFPAAGTSKGVKLSVIDISRGGVGGYSKVLKVNDEVPVKIQYGNTVVKTDLKIVASKNGRVGGKFVNTDAKNDDKLVYLSSLLEFDSGILKTKLAPM